MPLADQLKAEMLQFRAKTLPSGAATYGSARERDHDDIVLAVALARWARHALTEPRLIDGRNHNGAGGSESGA